jgi:hypothetical protein
MFNYCCVYGENIINHDTRQDTNSEDDSPKVIAVADYVIYLELS